MSSLCLLFYVSLCLSRSVSLCLSFPLPLSVSFSMSLSVCLSVSLCLSLPPSLSSLSLYLSLSRSIYLSIYLSIHLSRGFLSISINLIFYVSDSSVCLSFLSSQSFFFSSHFSLSLYAYVYGYLDLNFHKIFRTSTT